MIEERECQRCMAATPGDYLCFRRCVPDLRALLRDLREVVAELETQVTRQSVGERNVGGRATETPLVFDERASDALDTVMATMARALAGTWFQPIRASRKWMDLTRSGRVLVQIDILSDHVLSFARHDPDAGLVFRDLTIAHGLTYVAIDRNPARMPIGVCDQCGRWVYSNLESDLCTCPCGEVYDVRATLERLSRDAGLVQGVTATQAIELYSARGHGVLNRNTLNSKVRRGRLAIVGQTDTGENLYSFASILDLFTGKTGTTPDLTEK